MPQAPTTIYSASAGSGKTYTLARDYLTLLFKHPFHDAYRYILAVTFTNKAVAEMKERIMLYLNAFTQEHFNPKYNGIYEHIKLETGLDDSKMRHKATSVRNKLLHDYAAFDIVTIDAFSHRILRTFSKDLDLPDGFEVTMDSKMLVTKAINRLLARSGHDKALTKTLISFSLEKIDAGRSWDIEYDLHEIAQLLLNETHFKYLQGFKEKDAGDFLRFRESINDSNTLLKKELQDLAKPILQAVLDAGITSDDFHYKAARAYKFLTASAQGAFDISPTTGYVANMATEAIANGKAGPHATEILEQLRPQLVELAQFYTIKYGAFKFHENILKSLVPLSLLNELAQEIDTIKREERIVPIFEFNGLLQNQIKDEPAPFIYERLGERYRNYFIDEFQDTSAMQWNNLKPLIDNAVLQERLDGTRGSLMLVGDAKQSIYRWRGGDADQFLDILNSDLLFGMPVDKQPLPRNYRSTNEVVTFNNQFFKMYSEHLTGDVYKKLYQEYLAQETNDLKNGYVQIDFIDTAVDNETVAHDYDEDAPEDDGATVYPIHVLRQINSVLQQGYTKGDICVLVRKHKHGNELARYLIQAGIKVVSGESLLVAISPRVQLLEHYMHMILAPNQDEPRYAFLMAYLELHPQEDVQLFIEKHLKSSLQNLFKALFHTDDANTVFAFTKNAVFQAAEIVANAMQLFDELDTRLQSFMEFIFNFSSGYEVSLHAFIEYWQSKKEKLSVPATADPDAVQIMTIHKSKGLEFPVVIVPYCDVKIDESRKATGWIPVDPAYYSGFNHVYIAMKEENMLYHALGDQLANIPAIYEEHVAKTQMDHINTLYVAFTRAAEQLYIICEELIKPATKQSYNSLLAHFVDTHNLPLVEHGTHKTARIGSFKTNIHKKETTNATTLLRSYNICIDPQRIDISTRKGLLWASGAAVAIEKGNILHAYLSHITYKEDLTHVRDLITSDHALSTAEKEALQKTIEAILKEENFGKYFSSGYEVRNEQAILLTDGSKIIPDRLLIKEKQVTIIDYKTGAQLSRHIHQVDAYASILNNMNFQVVEKVLIYTDLMESISWS